MDIDKIWKEGEWTTHARHIINGLKSFPDDSKIILILRHSHRNEPKILEEAYKLRLTPQGHAVAKKFGENLLKSRSIRISHSIIWRCEETASNIHEGFKNIGGKSDLKGTLKILSDIGINGEYFMDQYKTIPFLDIFYRWVVGFYDPKGWTPFIEYCQKSAQLIMNQVDNSPEDGLNIFVTHDLNLMALRFGWFGLPPERWVKFLGGFAFAFDKDRILLLDYYGEVKKVEIPYWWSKP